MPQLKVLLCLLSLAWSAAAIAAAPLQTIDMNGKTALVTGSTSGLGEVVARRLGRMGATVIVHGLDETRGRAIAAEITAAGPGRATFQPGDLSSLEEVRRLAARIRAAHPRLNLLINNAGILGAPGQPRRESRDGHELHFAINYLSHFLLTRELLPLLEAGAPARIVNVASGAQRPVDFDDVMLTRNYDSGNAYSQSKLAQVLFTLTLSEQLDPARVTVNALHPATLMNTPMVQGAGYQPRSSVEDGADAVMQLAVGRALTGRTGLYFNQLNEAKANAWAYDPAARKRLWDLSVALTTKPTACDRACLQKWVDDYLVAMRDQNRDPALFARDLKFTENGVRLPLGKEGLWWGMSGIGTYKFYIPDTETQQIAFLGTVRENGKTGADGDLVAIALRLKIRDQRITEIEQIVSRPSNVNSSRGDFPPTGQGVEAMGAPHPIFTTPIPENERASRAELIRTANYYFAGLENNDGKGYYPFTDDCVRFENAVDVLARGGTRTTCKKQFEEGLKGIVDRVRDRRFVAVDRERGIVFAFGFFDHYRINWTWQLAELFRIEKGQIRRIEAIFHRAPFGTASGWSTYEQSISSEIQDAR